MTYVIFGRKTCPYCQRAVMLLIKTNNDYYFSEFNNMNSKQKNELYDRGLSREHTTVPVIFNNGKFLGGLSELKKSLNF